MKLNEYMIQEDETMKLLRSHHINYNFNKKNGYMATWGKTIEDDPDVSPVGPFIWDCEISTICNGPGASSGKGKVCKFCYKGNTPNGKNMSFDTFQKLHKQFPKTLTQVAFGSGSTGEENPEIWKMMDYCRNNDYNQIVPNITVADISDETADRLVKYCGACAVSRYDDKNICYDSVKKLTDRGLTQCNIHQLISLETMEQAIETIKDYKTDNRLAKLNAIVLLSLKQKGRGIGYTPLTQEQFKELVDLAFELKVPVGFDSCGCHKFIKAIEGRDNFKELEMLAEPCESSCMSSYTSVDGAFFPCSFTEGTEGWENGIDVVACDNFMRDIWYNKKVTDFREVLLKCKRHCPLFNV